MTNEYDMNTADQIQRLNDLTQTRAGGSETPFFTTTEMPSKVEVGQMWRARWDDAVALVLIDSVVEGVRHEVRVAPITFDDTDADETAVIVDAENSPLSVALTIWPDLVANIAEIVLEHWVASFRAELSNLALLEEAADEGVLQRGVPILNLLGARASERDALAVVMEVLEEATVLVSGNGKLPDLLLASGVTVTVLARALSEPNSYALSIAQGEAFVDVRQSELLSPIVDLPPSTIFAANPSIPELLEGVLTSLERSASLRAAANRRSMTTSAMFADVTQQAFALAARNEGESRDWGSRVDLYLQTS